jgi:CheY-like chemotaxis protein
VLVVEDNTVNQLVILGMLKRLGIMPDIASNGLEGVEQVKAAAQPYDVILMDCEMPLMDGYTATERIREYEQGSNHHTCIIALTAHAMSEHLARSQAVGMDEHVVKPVSLDVLRDVLERAVPERQQTQRVSTGG